MSDFIVSIQLTPSFENLYVYSTQLYSHYRLDLL